MLKKALIIGGFGFIGSELSKECLKNNFEVTILSRSKDKISNIEEIKDKVGIIIKNLRDIDEEVKGFDVIFNLSGSTDNYSIIEGAPYRDIELNCINTIALLEAIKKYNPKVRLVFASTFFVNGNQKKLPISENSPCEPLGLYGATRLAAEHFCKIYHNVFDLDIVIARFTNVYGENEKGDNKKKAGFNFMIKQACDGKEINLYNNGNFYRDYIHVNDAAKACIVLEEKGKSNKVYYVGTGKFIKFKKLIDEIVKNTGAKVNSITPPDFHKRVGIKDFVADVSDLKKLGWKAEISYKEGIKRTIKYYKSM